MSAWTDWPEAEEFRIALTGESASACVQSVFPSMRSQAHSASARIVATILGRNMTTEPSADLLAAAHQLRQAYAAFVRVGFASNEAAYFCGCLLARNPNV